jgi:DNA-binding response OmpR family regulator
VNSRESRARYSDYRNLQLTMPQEQPAKPNELAVVDLTAFLEAAALQTWPLGQEPLQGPKSFRVAFGQDPIHLGPVEFRILLFLASRPYHPFTRRSIAEAIATPGDPVTEEAIDEHIDALRDQLGVLHDYVQTVPYIGYRFKA